MLHIYWHLAWAAGVEIASLLLARLLLQLHWHTAECLTFCIQACSLLQLISGDWRVETGRLEVESGPTQTQTADLPLHTPSTTA